MDTGPPGGETLDLIPRKITDFGAWTSVGGSMDPQSPGTSLNNNITNIDFGHWTSWGGDLEPYEIKDFRAWTSVGGAMDLQIPGKGTQSSILDTGPPGEA